MLQLFIHLLFWNMVYSSFYYFASPCLWHHNTFIKLTRHLHRVERRVCQQYRDGKCHGSHWDNSSQFYKFKWTTYFGYSYNIFPGLSELELATEYVKRRNGLSVHAEIVVRILPMRVTQLFQLFHNFLLFIISIINIFLFKYIYLFNSFQIYLNRTIYKYHDYWWYFPITFWIYYYRCFH